MFLTSVSNKYIIINLMILRSDEQCLDAFNANLMLYLLNPNANKYSI
jgi:hypothetical protein